MRRVVVTGAGARTALGDSWNEIRSALDAGRSGLGPRPELAEYDGIRSRIGGVPLDEETPEVATRKQLRAMSRAGVFAVLASERALRAAGLLKGDSDSCSTMSVAYGTCLHGPEQLMRLAQACNEKSFRGIPATTYMQTLGHGIAAHLSMIFGMTGRLLALNSACTSSSQAIGFAFESIRNGYTDCVLAGGAEEFSPALVGLFDSVSATTPEVDNPESQPRPFDASRSGLALAEGACSLVLEELEHARGRGAPILAEVCGFDTRSDAGHLTQPCKERTAETMRGALRSAGVSPSSVGFIHAHATATGVGDRTESSAIAEVLGTDVPVGALKSYFGHTLGAAGALEAWFAIEMMRDGRFHRIKNLSDIDKDCAPLAYLTETREIRATHVMTNNLAFGGVNTSLVLGSPELLRASP